MEKTIEKPLFYKKALPYALLLLVTVGVYYPILNNQLLDYWDDQWVVMNYYTEAGVNGQNIWNILTQFYHGQYAPFNEFLYLTVYNIFGYDPFFFHLSSMILHLVNTYLVYFVFIQLFAQSQRINQNKIKSVSFLTALIFAIHPLNVESVAWMSASKVLVYSCFYLLATCSFLHFLKTRKANYYIATIILFIFSFFGKEQAVTFPVWMLLIYWLLKGSLTDKTIWKITLPFFILSIIGGITTMMSQSTNNEGALTIEMSYPLWQRIIYACYSFVEYLSKCIFPFKISYLYPFPSIVGEPLPTWLLFYPTMIIIIFFTLKDYLSYWVIQFGLLLFLIHIAITLHIIPLSRFAVVADRYAYLSTTGTSSIIAYFFIWLYQKLQRLTKMVLLLVLGGYMFYMGIYSNLRSKAWYNVDSLKKEIRDLLKHRFKEESLPQQ